MVLARLRGTDLLRAASVEEYAKDGKISNYMTMGLRLERFGDVRIVDERNGSRNGVLRKWI